MKTKIKEYSLVGFTPTKDYIDTLEKLGFKYIESINRRDIFKHKDGSRIEYYINGRMCNHFYKFTKYSDLLKRVYSLHRFLKYNGLKAFVVHKVDKTRKYDSKLYIRGIRQMRPHHLEKGKFMLDYKSKHNKTSVMCDIHKDDTYYYLSIYICNIKFHENK